jgi:hypothetical protein
MGRGCVCVGGRQMVFSSYKCAVVPAHKNLYDVTVQRSALRKSVAVNMSSLPDKASLQIKKRQYCVLGLAIMRRMLEPLTAGIRNEEKRREI